MVTKRLMLRIVKEIKKIMEEQRLSSRKLTDLCNQTGHKTTRSKILRAFYTDEGKQFFLNNTDDTIEAVLSTLNLSGDDILKRILDEDNNITHIVSQTELPQEIINFIRTKEAEPYLKLAYAQYKKAEAQKEVERIQNEILAK